MPRIPRTVCNTLGALALAACAASAAAQSTAKGIFVDRKGDTIGSATLVQTPAGVLIAVEIRGLPTGELAFHVHERGACEPDKGFETAGGHYNPRGHAHGYRADKGPHAGDMPNQVVPESGVLRAQVLNHMVTLEKGEATLFDADGSALVLHAKPDDYRSQPAGAAGDRIACAVVTPGDGK
jgi:Cu-Zn family superoxide dismutase